jgi:hypothetical protein
MDIRKEILYPQIQGVTLTPFELERHGYVHLVAAQLYHHLVAHLMKRARQSLAHIFRLDDSN